MTLQEFVAKYNGKKIDWDLAYQGQCVDLFRQYVHEVLVLSQPKSVQGAADFWTNYESDPVLNQNFTKISNSETFVPQAGDIGIWNRKAGGGFGHVGVCTGKGDVNTFESFDQNWKTISVCELISHNYTNFYGVLRPNRKPEDLGKQLSECELHKTNLQNQVNGLLKDIEAQKGVISDTETKLGTANGRIQELTKQNEDLGQQLGAVRGELTAAIQKIDTQNKVISSYVNEDAVQLETLKRLERENYDTKTLLGGLLSHFAQLLKVSLGSESQEDAISKVIDAFDAFYSSSSSANDKIKSLEAEVKKLTTQSRHISKLTTKDCIIILIDKLKEKYGKK